MTRTCGQQKLALCVSFTYSNKKSSGAIILRCERSQIGTNEIACHDCLALCVSAVQCGLTTWQVLCTEALQKMSTAVKEGKEVREDDHMSNTQEGQLQTVEQEEGFEILQAGQDSRGQGSEGDASKTKARNGVLEEEGEWLGGSQMEGGGSKEGIGKELDPMCGCGATHFHRSAPSCRAPEGGFQMARGCMRVLPHLQDTGGFFIALREYALFSFHHTDC